MSLFKRITIWLKCDHTHTLSITTATTTPVEETQPPSPPPVAEQPPPPSPEYGTGRLPPLPPNYFQTPFLLVPANPQIIDMVRQPRPNDPIIKVKAKPRPTPRPAKPPPIQVPPPELPACAICLETVPPHAHVALSSCKHTFCTNCIADWCKKQKTCPICRRAITETLHHLDSPSIVPPHPSAPPLYSPPSAPPMSLVMPSPTF